MKLRHLILGASFLLASLPAGAVRAYEGLRTYVQPDGTTVRVKTVGDEFAHYDMTEDGYIVTYDADGFCRFASVTADGCLVSEGISASVPAVSLNVPEKLTRFDYSLLSAKKAVRFKEINRKRVQTPQNGMGLFSMKFPTKGDVRALVIIVEFSDKKCQLQNPRQYFEDFLNKDGFSDYGGTGCVTEWFRDNSKGQFNPQFDLYGPVTLPQTCKFYGGNNVRGDDSDPEQMIIDACRLIDDQCDFTKYDNDGDGVVDNVFVFYAGRGEATGGGVDTVWPHSFELSSVGRQIEVDGVLVDKYGCTNEWVDNHPDGIGTFIHEFSHVMGLPDLYSTDNGHNATPGFWSVMDYGPYSNDGRTPPSYSSFERNALGWTEPNPLSDPVSISLTNLPDSNECYMIQTPVETEFFLLENRQQTGWDKYLPGHGMLIWHVDFDQNVWDMNTVNNQAYHMRVEIKKANNIMSQSDAACAGWCWPGTSGKTEFTDRTKPSMKTWANESLNMPLTNIREENGIIYLDVAGGTPPVSPVKNLAISDITADGFLASWDPCENATDYVVTVCEKSDVVAVEDICDFGSLTSSGSAAFEIPEGWTASSQATYISTSNFGQNPPSMKFSDVKGVPTTLETCEYTSDIYDLSFWMKGQSISGSTLDLEGFVNGEWRNLTSFTPTNTAETVRFTEFPAGTRKLRFTFNKVKGNLAVDDVKVYSGVPNAPVEGYDGISTGGQTSFKVSGLDKEKLYLFEVYATDGTYRTPVVSTDEITLGENGIYTVGAASAVVSVIGRTVISADSFSVCDITGRDVAVVNGAGSVTLDPGVYIIRAGKSVRKVAIR